MGRLPGVPAVMATQRLDDLEADEVAEDGLAGIAAYLTADERQQGAL